MTEQPIPRSPANSDPLVLPIGGVSYSVASPTAAEGLRLHKLVVGDNGFDPDRTAGVEMDVIESLLGPVVDEMDANGVSLAALLYAGRAAILHFLIHPAHGEAYWHVGVLGNTVADVAPTMNGGT